MEIHTLQSLKAAVAEPTPFVVARLIERGSINLIVGGSGLGKTPLCVQMGLCIATGSPFLGLPTTRKRVLYCDAESGLAKFEDHLETLAGFLGVPEAPNFQAWSPTWFPAAADPGERLLEKVRETGAEVVFVDPLRSFFLGAEQEAKEAATLYQRLRANIYHHVTWIIVHHTRKPSQDGVTRLDNDPFGWMHEAAGTAALVNHADGRLGIEAASAAQPYDALISGYVRSLGPIPALRIQRVMHSNSDDPLGYLVVQDLSLLGKPFADALTALAAQGPTFRFTDLCKLLVRPGQQGSWAEKSVSKSLREARQMGFLDQPGGKGTPYVFSPRLRGGGKVAVENGAK